MSLGILFICGKTNPGPRNTDLHCGATISLGASPTWADDVEQIDFAVGLSIGGIQMR